jgi:hypothetical protein
MKEDFKPILGYEGHYEINSEGVVKSVKRGQSKILTPALTKCGYQQVNLYLHGRKTKLVHRLVWETFKGEIPNGMLVLHGEGVSRDDCCIDNLSLGSYEDNLGRDRRRDGTTPKGENNCKAKLTEQQVAYIKARLRDNEFSRTLSQLFNVGMSAIQDIRKGKTWSHIA